MDSSQFLGYLHHTPDIVYNRISNTGEGVVS